MEIGSRMKLLVILLACMAQVYAQTNTTKTDVNRGQFRKFKPLTFEMLLASEQTRDIYTQELDGQFTKWDFSLLQTFNNDNQFRYFLSTRYVTSQEFRDEFNWFLFELMYRRRNILTQSTHGVNMEVELKNYWLLDETLKDMYGYDGSFIPQVIFNRRYGRGFSTEVKLRRHFYHRNNTDNFTVSKEDRIYLTQSYMFGHRWLANVMVKYQHKMRKGDDLNYRFMPYFNELVDFGPYGPDFSRFPKAKKNQEIVTIHPSMMYFWSRQTLIEGYIETRLSDTYDKRDLETIAGDEFVFGAAVYMTVF